MADFLVDASLPRATGDVIRSNGGTATDVRDIGLGTSSDDAIARYAHSNSLAIITADQDFGNVSAYPPADYCGIAVLRPPEGSATAALLALVQQLVTDETVMFNLNGRLAIVEPGRIRVRPAI
jgi:Domain of unknown function (DUF5615)